MFIILDKPINKKTISILVVVHFFLISLNGTTQNNTSKNSNLYLELGGSAGLGSLNYEKEFAIIKKSKLSLRTGLGIAPIDKNNGFGLVFPLMINSIIGENKNKLELGIGQGITITTKGNFFLLTTLNLGYRYQHPEKKIFYRITYAPLVSYLVDFQWQHWFGISIGFTLNTKSK